jgi:hypothetical protein
MPVRLLDAVASQLTTMNAAALKDAIRLSDGRTIAAEVICTHQSYWISMTALTRVSAVRPLECCRIQRR